MTDGLRRNPNWRIRLMLPTNCKDCGSSDLDVRDNGPHKELYCKACGKYQKFLNRTERKLWETTHGTATS